MYTGDKELESVERNRDGSVRTSNICTARDPEEMRKKHFLEVMANSFFKLLKNRGNHKHFKSRIYIYIPIKL